MNVCLVVKLATKLAKQFSDSLRRINPEFPQESVLWDPLPSESLGKRIQFRQVPLLKNPP